MLIAAFIVGVLTGGMLFAAVQADAWRAERIYRARHRDHSKVPAIHAGRSAALWAEAAAVDQLDERSTEEFRNVLVRNSGGELAPVSSPRVPAFPAALWAEAAAVDQPDERSTEEFRNVLVRNSGGELALVSPGGSGVAHA